jgi:hypothetical protein
MEIFGKIISSEDAKIFCKLSEAEKRAWIEKYTKQRNENLITDFINNPPKNKDCGCGCGGSKNKSNGNITGRVSQTVAEDKKNNRPKGNRKRGANKGGIDTQSS